MYMSKIPYAYVFHALKCVRFVLAVVSHTSCQVPRFFSAFVVLASKKHKINLSGTCQCVRAMEHLSGGFISSGTAFLHTDILFPLLDLAHRCMRKP